LRALQEGRITRVGGEKDIKVDVRVIAATNKDLRKEIAAKRFREDLYHRLAVIIIQVPSLNERKEDIPLLADHFIESVCTEYGRQKKEIAAEAIDLLKEVDWTGNIRELRNVIERLIILSDQTITQADIENYVMPTMNKHHQLAALFEKFGSLESIQAHIVEEYQQYSTKKAKA
jgi:DNA-binding NtrC family response regulator